MPCVSPAPLSAWMLAGPDAGVAPALGDDLLLPGRPRRRVRWRGARRLRAAAGSELQDHGHRALGVLRRPERRFDVHLDRRVAAVVDLAEQLLLDHRHAADGLLGGVRDGPRHLGGHLRHPTVDLAVEQLDDLGPADVPPRLRGRDARARLRYHELGQRRVGRHLRLVVVGEVGRLLVAAFDAAADLGDAEERQHPLVVGLGRFLGRLLRGRRRERRARRRRRRRLGGDGATSLNGGRDGERRTGDANRFGCEHWVRGCHNHSLRSASSAAKFVEATNPSGRS